MSVFGDYAKYYDLLYKDKDYQKEADYVDSLIKKHLKDYKEADSVRILEIGCGTGKHAHYLSQKGYTVVGIDMSEEMINIAKSKENENLQFHLCNATDFNLEKKFDVIISLFHVMSYQTSNDDLEKSFQNTSAHLRDGGIFVFDCWYGPAVLTDKPVVRVKRLEDDKVKIIRTVEPVFHANENRVDVNYQVLIIDKKSNIVQEIKETHKMRYLFKPEIEFLFKANNMNLKTYEEWMTAEQPGSDTWGVVFVGIKK